MQSQQYPIGSISPGPPGTRRALQRRESQAWARWLQKNGNSWSCSDPTPGLGHAGLGGGTGSASPCGPRQPHMHHSRAPAAEGKSKEDVLSFWALQSFPVSVFFSRVTELVRAHRSGCKQTLPTISWVWVLWADARGIFKRSGAI